MKNLIAPAVVGLLCMTGGFWYGLKLMPVPPKPKVAEVAKIAAVAPTAVPDPISLDTLKKASDGMMTLNEALRAREQAVAVREQKVRDREDELNAERATLDASHEKFKTLFKEFQDRLQLVDANQVAQLQKQADLYTSMGMDQALELIRAMDDPEMTRLFTVVDTKPLGKMIVAWKTKYPQDAPRLLHVLDAMAQVMPKEKIALTDPPATTNPPPANDAPAAAPAPDPTAPATTPSAPTNEPPPLTPPPDSSPLPGKSPTSTTSTASN